MSEQDRLQRTIAQALDEGVEPPLLIGDPKLLPRYRSYTSWWQPLEDGRLELVVYRRVGASEGTWSVHRFVGVDEAECEVLYDRYCRDSYERSAKRAGARANHGIKGYL